MFGVFNKEYLVLEIDERSFPHIRKVLPGKNLGLTNLQKDQVQRNGDPDFIYRKISSALSKDMTFELYQKIGEGAHRLYNGTWELDEDTAMLTGKYNDGAAWGSGYTVTLSEDGNSMTLTSSKDDSAQVYRKENIPSEVKEKAVVIVRSDAGCELPVL